MGITPQLFEVRDDYYLFEERPREDLRPLVDAAAAARPKQAITVVDD